MMSLMINKGTKKMKVVTKSRYLTIKRCIKEAWLDLHHPYEAILDPALDKRALDGKIVGEYAKKLFPNVIDVTSYREDKSLDINNMIGLTNRYLASGDKVIAEASFLVDNLFCSIDLLKPVGEEYEIYEVKATTKVEKEHLCDAAFQKYVLEKRGLKVKDVYIVHLNNDYIRKGDIDVDKLFKIERVTLHPDFLFESSDIENQLANFKIVEEDELNNEDNYFSSNCSGCKYQQYCLRKLPKPNVTDINGLRDKYVYLRNNIITFTDVLTSGVKLNKRQRVQVNSYLNNKEVVIDVKAIKNFLKTIKYPVYHLDFESIQLPIPPSDNSWPYEQIPTQYSLHIEYENGHLEHKEFLGNSIDPRREIAESLCKDIPMGVCVLAYNKTFECSRIQELADLFPDLREHLLNIKENVVDLIIPFKNGSYYHKDMGGSNSIKYVLPALFPVDPELDYHALPLVHNGGEAMDIYPKMIEAQGREKSDIRDGLLKYCCLDTLAMVKVLSKLKEIVQQYEGRST